MSKSLSPATQAVLDAAVGAYEPNVVYEHRISIAAALRALAERIRGADGIREDILAIADELEVAQ